MIDVTQLKWIDKNKIVPRKLIPYLILPFTEERELSDVRKDEEIILGYWMGKEFVDVEYQSLWAKYYLSIPDSYIK